MALLSSPWVKGENIEWLLFVKEVNMACVNLAKLNLHVTESPSLNDSGWDWAYPETHTAWWVDVKWLPLLSVSHQSEWGKRQTQMRQQISTDSHSPLLFIALPPYRSKPQHRGRQHPTNTSSPWPQHLVAGCAQLPLVSWKIWWIYLHHCFRRSG